MLVMKEDMNENKNREDKCTLIDCAISAMFVPKDYGKLLKVSTGKVILYVLVITFFVTLIQYAIPGLGSIAGLGGMKKIIMNELPEFSFEDGQFFYEEKIEQKDEVSGIYMILDTSVEEFKKSDIPKNMSQAVMVSKSNMLVYNSLYGVGGMIDIQNFSDFKGVSISNKTVAEHSGIIYFGLLLLFIVMYIVSIIEYLMTAFLFTLFTYMFVKLLTKNLTFGMMYKVAIFAKTIGIIVESVTICLGIELFYLAGALFNVVVTTMIINKVIVKYRMHEAV